MILVPVCTWLGLGSILSKIAVLCYLHILETRDYDTLHGCQSSLEGFSLNMALLFLFVLTLVLETCRNDVVGFSLNDRVVQN